MLIGSTTLEKLTREGRSYSQEWSQGTGPKMASGKLYSLCSTPLSQTYNLSPPSLSPTGGSELLSG